VYICIVFSDDIYICHKILILIVFFFFFKYSYIIIVSAFAYGLAYEFGFFGTIKLMFFMVVVDFLLVGFIISTITW